MEIFFASKKADFEKKLSRNAKSEKPDFVTIKGGLRILGDFPGHRPPSMTSSNSSVVSSQPETESKFC